MPLTPEDVSNKRFTPVRLREGYDMGEVDQFLDEVESELSRLTRENDELRSRLSAARQGEPSGDTAFTRVTEPTAEAEPEPEPTPEPTAEPTPAPVEATVATPVETLKVTTAAEASTAATRLLELGTRSADELVAEARAEAGQIVGEARTEAERLAAESKERAEQVESEARNRSQRLDGETEERRRQLLGDLERDRDKLNGDVENLRSFEREYRSRLKGYFEQQLAALDGSVDSAGDSDGRSAENGSLLAGDQAARES